MYIEDSVDERHMWRLGRLVRNLLLCHNEHVYHSISLLALVDLHRLSICLDGWYLVLLYNWDIDDRDVLDQRNWCLLHHWHIDNFVDGLCLSLHWDIDNLVNELHLRDLHSFLLCTTTGTSSSESQAPGFAPPQARLQFASHRNGLFQYLTLKYRDEKPSPYSRRL